MTQWHLQPRMWAFIKGRRIVLETVCDMNAADIIGLRLYHRGESDAWTLSKVARELGYANGQGELR